MNKPQILIIAFLISLSICALSSTQVKAAVLNVTISPSGPITMDVGQVQMFTATAKGGSGSLSSQWYLDNSLVGSDIADYSFSATSTGPHLITVFVTDFTDNDQSSVSVTVAASPTVSIAPVGIVMMDVGQDQLFTAVSSGGSGTIHYQWYLGGSVVSGATSSTYSFSRTAGSYSVTCKVTDSASSPVTSPASNAVSVTVNSALVAPTISASLGMINQGQTLVLSNSSSVSTGTSPYSYQWLSRAPGAGSYSLISGATSSSYSFVTSGSTVTGVWSFELQVTDAVSSVVTSNAVSITVNAIPTVTVSPASWSMDMGQSKIFSASASGGSGSYSSYQWYVGGAAQSGATSSTFSYVPGSVGSYLITVTVTDSLGTISAQSSAVSVVVNVALGAPIVTLTSGTVDRGQTSSLTSSSVSTGTSPYSYQWLSRAPGAGSYSLISGATSSSYSFVTSGSTVTGVWSFELQVTDAVSSVVTSNAVSVTVNSALVAPTISASLGMINQGQTLVLSNSSSVSTGTSPYSYQWLSRAPGAGSYSLISGATSSSYSFVTSGSTVTGVWSFELQVTDAVSSVVTSNAVSITVNAIPTVTVSPASWSMDMGQSKIFSASASGGSGSYSSYQWYVGGAAQSGATSSTFSYVPGSVGSYLITVTVTDSLGTISAQSSAVSVVVNVALGAPIVTLTSGTVDRGQTSSLTSSSVSTGTSPYSYQWLSRAPGAGSYSLISGATSSSYSFVTSGSTVTGVWSFELQVTDAVSSVVTSNAVSVTVNSALVAPTISASLGMINQGQTLVLSNSSSVSTGTSPYSYQWLSRAPGAGSYSLISGATSNSYNFVTSIVTATGNWSFALQVNDNAGASVNSSIVSVIVNIPPLDHFVFTTVSTQTAGTSFNITIVAKDALNNTLTNFVGTNTLNVSTGTISPTSTGAFSKGVWTGSVTVTEANSGTTLFTTGSGMTGTSNSFTVNPGALNRFTFSTVSSPQTAGSGFNLTVTANDAYGNIVTGYIGRPSLIVSAGSISPSTMNAFVNGIGSTSVTVTGAGSGVTITATDSIYSGISNSFTVTIATTPNPSPTPTSIPTPTPTPSPTTEPTPAPTSTSTNTPTVTPTPTARPSPPPTPLETTVKAKTDNGLTVNLAISGNITSSQISNATITTNQSSNSTIITMTVTGQSGNTGFSNITIPKTAILYGTNPVIFIDGQQALNQGYTQDSENFYVWHTTQFSTHQMKIQFTGPLTSQASSFEPLLAVGILTPEIILVYTVIAIRRLRRSPENI